MSLLKRLAAMFSTPLELEGIEVTYSKLQDWMGSDPSRGDRFDALVQSGDGMELAKCLREIYGQLAEVWFVSGPFKGHSIMLFRDGTGILAGNSTLIGTLGQGYGGQGSSMYSSLLKEFGFVDPDATSVTPPMILTSTGQRIEGTRVEESIRWQDGRSLNLEYGRVFSETFGTRLSF
jgi:hypothetical protein